MGNRLRGPQAINISSKQEWDDDVGSRCSHPTCWRRQGNSAVLSICHSIGGGERLGRPRLGYFVRFAFRMFRLLILVLFILAHHAADSVVLPYLYWHAQCTKQIKGLYQLWVVAESKIRKKRKETPDWLVSVILNRLPFSQEGGCRAARWFALLRAFPRASIPRLVLAPELPKARESVPPTRWDSWRPRSSRTREIRRTNQLPSQERFVSPPHNSTTHHPPPKTKLLTPILPRATVPSTLTLSYMYYQHILPSQ